MRRETQNVLLILLGGALVKIALNGDYLRYVKPAQQPWIIAGGAVMILLGAAAVIRDLLAARSAAKSAETYAPTGNPAADQHPRAHPLQQPPPADPTPHPPGETHSPTNVTHLSADVTHPASSVTRLSTDVTHPATDTHGHHHPARSAWLLVVPVLAVFLVAPPALGADSVTRTEARLPASAATTSAAAFPPLPAGAVVPMAMNEVVTRAGWDANGTLNGRTVELSGFVVHAGGQTLLARLVISCCAADAAPVTVHLKQGADRFPSDTWLRVTGQVVPGTATEANSYTPDLVPATVERISAPKDPYEY
ncbi:TIGR03943 family putative permease subunit [Amycolatopsis jejuensis]|uniref:TIGR03943 family putative permease subunit n=1 Tax=Amycolatopsis jejuensis TaxID=330084 RepID=UPI000524E6CA|nr:TIGR03943 family protein [Amycolatopsis jejuensis]